MFEIWRHLATGERYLVALHDRQLLAAAGPLAPDEDPAVVLARHSNQHHNPQALLTMHKAPSAFIREYASPVLGQVVKLPDLPAG